MLRGCVVTVHTCLVNVPLYSVEVHSNGMIIHVAEMIVHDGAVLAEAAPDSLLACFFANPRLSWVLRSRLSLTAVQSAITTADCEHTIGDVTLAKVLQSLISTIAGSTSMVVSSQSPVAN